MAPPSHRQQALALANYLATTEPAPGQSFDDFMLSAVGRWPALRAQDIDWACARAAQIARGEASQLADEADALERVAPAKK